MPLSIIIENRKDLHDGCQVNDTEEAEQGSEAAIEICFHSPYQRQDLYRPVPGRGPQGDAQAHGEEAHGEEGHGEEGRGPQGTQAGFRQPPQEDLQGRIDDRRPAV